MQNRRQAPLGVALIARNSSETIGACLDSIRPYVAQIVIGLDETTTDNTKKVARKHGADVIFPIKVSDWHECTYHGRVLTQHFANARNQSFSKLDPNLDAYMWLDSDDIVKGAELFPSLCEQLKNTEAVGAWLPYHYATMNNGRDTNTLFHRERLLRVKGPDGKPIKWTWQHRVHEVVVPGCSYPPQWLMLDQPAIYHQEHGHDSSTSAKRNLLLLEIDLEENPEDARAIFYMGNQYFAMGDMRNATQWYERLGAVGKNPYELWQSWCYCALAYERLGDLDNATKAAYCAIDVQPRHPEPYYRLASIYLLAGEFDKVEYWTEQANTKEKPPFFVFKNPLDYNFNSKMPLADALAAQGKIHQARAVLEEAYAALPDERVGKAIVHYKELETAEEKANSFLRLTNGWDDTNTIALWEKVNFEPNVRQFGRIRDRVMPAYLRRRTGRPRAIFWCGRSLEEWSPETLNTTGIGGSETAVIEIARRFANDGWLVDVYNGAGRFEGEYSEVGYWEPERLKPNEECDLYVSWRRPQDIPQIKAPKAILWCHDLHYGPQATPFMQGWASTPGAAICGVSGWHAGMLARYYNIHAGAVQFVPNGIDLTRFPHLQTKERPRKEPFQLVYASSPDRGLAKLLTLWPRILEREPGATLKIAYGWENTDKAIAAGRQDLAAMKQSITNAVDKLPNVEWLGRLPQDKVAELYTTSAVWAYPTHFLEVSCISAMEAMAGGAIPITSAVGALPETIGDAGLLLPGQPDTRTWQDMYVEVLLGALESPQMRWDVQYKGHIRVLDLTWDMAYSKWKEVLARLNVKEMVTA